MKIFKAHPAKGVGAGGYATARLRYRTDDLDGAPRPRLRRADRRRPRRARPACASACCCWPGPARRGRDARLARAVALAAAGRASPTAPSASALLTLATIVAGLRRALVRRLDVVRARATRCSRCCAGWVVGRGPLYEPAPSRATSAPRLRRRRPPAGARRAGAVGGAGARRSLAAWTAWQPLRSVHADNDALAVADKDYNKALAYTRTAQDRNPLSIDPLLTRAVVETTSPSTPTARAPRSIEAVRLQPSNPSTWEYLSRFTVDQDRDPTLAMRLLGPALYLDPQSPTGAQDYLDALRLATQQAQAKAAQEAKDKAAEARRRRRRRRAEPARAAARRLPGRPARRPGDRAAAAAGAAAGARLGGRADVAGPARRPSSWRRPATRGSRWRSAAWSTARARGRWRPGRGRASCRATRT